MERPPRSASPRKDLRASVLDGVAFSLMVGMGETYVSAFALAIGMGQTVAGLLSTVPLLAGAGLQLISPRGVRIMGSHRRWVLLCGSLQGLAFLPLSLAAIAGGMPVAGIFLVVTLYWGAGLATSPAWNIWIEHLVPARVRARYFAQRQRFANAGVLVGLLAGGTLLQTGANAGHRLAAFALCFGLAVLFRATSIYFLSHQRDLPHLVADDQRISFTEGFQRLRGREGGRLLRYLLATHIAVYVSAAYFTPYMLGQLHLSYIEYMVLLSASLLGKFALLPRLGGLARRLGPHRLLWLGGIGIAPLPLLWLLSHNFLYLLVVQIYSGAAWAALDLGGFLLLFDAIRSEERVGILTLFNVAQAVAQVTGSLFGAAILGIFAATPLAFVLTFMASTLLRGLVLALAPKPPPDAATEIGQVGAPTQPARLWRAER